MHIELSVNTLKLLQDELARENILASKNYDYACRCQNPVSIPYYAKRRDALIAALNEINTQTGGPL